METPPENKIDYGDIDDEEIVSNKILHTGFDCLGHDGFLGARAGGPARRCSVRVLRFRARAAGPRRQQPLYWDLGSLTAASRQRRSRSGGLG